MTPLDLIIIALTIFAAVMGWRSGLLRSLATILGYALAVPLAIALAPKLAPLVQARAEFVALALLIALGFGFGALLRQVTAGIAGAQVGLFDRLAGATLGIVRIALLAILMMLIFDKIIPAKRQPDW